MIDVYHDRPDGHPRYIASVLRRRAESERNAQGCETQFARVLADAADLIVNAYLHPDVVDVDTGGRL